jgi:type III restriction enzyme
VLWLVPSNTILDQTARALGNPQHPYRRALEVGVGPVEILTIEQALRMKPPTVDGQTVVIVATIQCFRVEDTEGRKVYDPGNGDMREHLLRAPPDRRAELEPGPDGQPANSLVNVLRLHRPIVIVDEAHNANTELSFATLAKVAPSCIIEFTATPNTKHNPGRGEYASNVLHRVSAAELKAADMIKMPIRVATRKASEGEELLIEAVALRADLENIAVAEAQETGEYLRPILLIQAPAIAETEPMRERLVADHNIPRDWIAISTGSKDELAAVKDLAAPTCPIRVIITVQKLSEGWDCPFAYVLCSLRPTRSATAIEQIVGRIMRLPSVRRKRREELNCAYALSVSESLPDVLGEMRAALEMNGFSAQEAALAIEPGPGPAPDLWRQPKMVPIDAAADLNQSAVEVHGPALADKVAIEPVHGRIVISKPLTPDELSAVQGCVTTPEKREALAVAAAAVAEQFARLQAASAAPKTGSELQADFFVPLLSIRLDQDVLEFDETILMERPWRLHEMDASLDEHALAASISKADVGHLDVGNKGQVTVEVNIFREGQDAKLGDFIDRLQQQVLALGGSPQVTVEDLIVWLDRNIPHQDISQEDAAVFLGKAVRGLMTSRSITDCGTLWRMRTRLRDAIEQRIAHHRAAARKAAYQSLLLDEGPLAVDPARGIDFRTARYEPGWHYDGGYVFKKHYFPPRPGELKDGTEEYLCAVFLDCLPQVKYWIRNIARRPQSSLWFQTSTDRAYPDFVCQLIDGRILAVEYKGKDRIDTADSQEKLAIGKVWESRSGGLCMYVMPSERNFQCIVDAIANDRRPHSAG